MATSDIRTTTVLPIVNQEKKYYTCHNCQKSCLRGDPSLIRADGNIYHKTCFKCDFCQKSVLQKFYLFKVDKSTMILCEKDYYHHNHFKCHQCHGHIANDEYALFGEYKYHKQCLQCPGCTIMKTMMIESKPDENEQRLDYNGRPYCLYHYSLIKGTACQGCGQTVLNEKTNETVKWHQSCYLIQKYWHIQLSDLEKDVINDKQQLLYTQNYFTMLRTSIWKDLSHFEDSTAKLISTIIATKTSPDHYYQLLIEQYQTLFTVLDLLFINQITHLSCDVPVKRLSDQLISFINQQYSSSDQLSQSTRDLVKLSLQQAILLERNYGSGVIQTILAVFNQGQYKKTLELPCLELASQLIDGALGLVFNMKPTRNQQRLLLNDEICLFNKAPSLIKQQKTMNYQSTPNLTSSTNSSSSLTRSKSTLPLQEKPPSRMESIRRALTTTRRRGNLARSSTTQSLHISLPDQLYTPPLSPPTSTTSLPNDLPQVQQQHDCILRHMALLYLELPVEEAEDILDLKKANNLWNKLKTHILTPTTEANPQLQQLQQLPVPSPPTSMSIFNLASMNTDTSPFQVNNQSVFFERWRTVCPSILSCFSAEAQIPIFLKHCILTLVDQDINTEGIFRKNGNIRGLKDMCDTLEQGYQEQKDWTPYFKQQPIVQLAAFVKKFLRELPEPLLTFKLHPVFMRHQRLETLHWAICALPKANRDILLLVLALLNWVARHAEDNKMDAENLARVMAPNILYSKRQAQDTSICHEEICIVATMIENYEKLIKVPAEIVSLYEHPKMSEYLSTNTMDLTCSKQFVKSLSQLKKVKKEILCLSSTSLASTCSSASSSTDPQLILPPSPSISAQYKH